MSEKVTALVVTQNERTVTVQTQTDRVVLPLSEVDEMTRTPLSPMPDGLFDNLTPSQIADLIAYLQHPTQVNLPE